MKDQSTEDKYIICKAKARYVYWQGEKDKVILICYLNYFLLHYIKYHIFFLYTIEHAKMSSTRPFEGGNWCF